MAAPAGWAVMAHGFDHFLTGMRTAVTGEYSETATSQLLQKTGMSEQNASLVDNTLSVIGTIGGAASIKSARVASLPSFDIPRSFCKNTKPIEGLGKYTVDELLYAGEALDRAGLTRAGRALDKHGNRCNSPFPRAFGDTASKNAQGRNQLNEILSNPNSKVVESSRSDVRIYSPDGRGAHFRSDGSFKGFLDYE